MKDTLIEVNNVSKAYRKYSGVAQRIMSWCGVNFNNIEETKILHNISFTVAAGEAVGIVGENGAGKSTLLKIITGTMQPTIGTVSVRGRVSAILELGLGFNPEMSGRDNVYLSAGVMGYRRDEIDLLTEEIKAFAELEDYFDQPVRTYSSGMQMRLAFSIATAVRPELLIVDEALSVGDAYFQHKSFNRIREFRNLGTSLLFVSHDKEAVQALCDRAILLEKGTLLKDASPEEVFDFYNALIADKESRTIETAPTTTGKLQTVSGTREATIEHVQILNSKGQPADHIHVGEEMHIEVRVHSHQQIESLVLGFGIKDRLGQVIYGTNTWYKKLPPLPTRAGADYLFRISIEANIGIGSYSVQVALHDGQTHLSKNYEWVNFAAVFNIISASPVDFVGHCHLDPNFQVSEA